MSLYLQLWDIDTIETSCYFLFSALYNLYTYISLFQILFTLILSYTESNSDLVSWQMFIFLLIGAFGHMTVCTSDTLHSDLLCDTSPMSIVILLIMLGTFAVSASIAFQFIMNRSYNNILRYISIQVMLTNKFISHYEEPKKTRHNKTNETFHAIYSYYLHTRLISRIDNLMFTSYEGNNCFIIPKLL